jgi:hypothetical protein
MGIRRPEASDFEVHRFETFIEVTFRPTRTVYTFTVHKLDRPSANRRESANIGAPARKRRIRSTP